MEIFFTMTKRHLTRRVILIGCGASVAALACGGDETGTSTASTSGTGGTGAGGSNTGGSNTGGSNTGGSNTGGSNTGGSNTGGANAGGANAGGANAGGAGGGMANACGGTLLVKGSNYAKDPHDVSVPLADLQSKAEKTYVSTGNGHDHKVTLTAADFEALRNGQTVKKYTCLQNPNFTDHEWVFSCADPNIQPTFEGEIGTPNNCPG